MLQILHDYGLILLVGQYPAGPLGGLAMTLILAAAALLLAFPLAVAVGVARTSSVRAIAWSAAAYVHTIRGLPLLLVVFWAYFAVPLLTGGKVSAWWAMLVALVAYEAAYLGEIVRAGIEALPRGQWQAARSLGLGPVATLRHVILPQALHDTIPSMLSQFVVLVKNTSLAYVIGVDELTNAAYQVNGQLLTRPFEVYALLAATYFVVCWTLGQGVSAVERRIGHARGRAPAA